MFLYLSKNLRHLRRSRYQTTASEASTPAVKPERIAILRIALSDIEGV